MIARPWGALIATLAMSVAAPDAHGQPFYDFDDGTLQGWTKVEPFNGDLTNPGWGGNPDGLLFCGDTQPGGGTLLARAPAAMSGDLSNYAGIAWDEFLHLCLDRTQSTFPILVGGDGTVYQAKDNEVRPPSSWRSRAVAFVADDWQRTAGSASFHGVLTNVAEVRMNMETNTQCYNESRIDNVTFVFVSPDTSLCSVEPWDTFGQAFVSPGTQSGVDLVDLLIVDGAGDPLVGAPVLIELDDCENVCVDSLDTGLQGFTDELGMVTLDPRVGGCDDDCEISIRAGGFLIRTYSRIVSPDAPWGSGVVDADDELYFLDQFDRDTPCADYDGDGVVGLLDEAMFQDAYSAGDSNGNQCRVPSLGLSWVDPWDLNNQVFVSPGTQSGVDVTRISVFDQFGVPYAGLSIEVDIADCPELCVDTTSLVGVTDSTGSLILDPEAGGCSPCDVHVLVDGIALRTYGGVVSPDWNEEYGADGVVTACDRAFFDDAIQSGDLCADYDGDGFVTTLDEDLFATAEAFADSNTQFCHPPQFVIDPWDEFGAAFVSPGGASSVDFVVISVRDSCSWTGLADARVEIDLSDCEPLCRDAPDDGLVRFTDATGVVGINPYVGGCDTCDVVVTASPPGGEFVLSRTFPRVSTTDWDGSYPDGIVDSTDAAWLGIAAATQDPCADYNNDGTVSTLDVAIFALAFNWDWNVRLCDPASVGAPLTEVPVGGSDPYLALGRNPLPRSVEAEILLYNPVEGDVSLRVYDVTGRRVVTLFDGPAAAGVTALRWRGRDADGSALAAGVYFLRMTTSQGSVVKRLVLLR